MEKNPETYHERVSKSGSTIILKPVLEKAAAFNVKPDRFFSYA
jgi:hypothetical protein